MSGCHCELVSRTTSAPVVPISVVISTLQRPVQLARCLDAILGGTQLPAEIVVVDQGDAPATTAVLDARRAAGVPIVHVLQRRRGLSASQNAGVERASCRVVAVVDDDCVPDARWVEVASRAHAEATGPLLIGGRVLALPAVGDRTVPLAERTSEQRLDLARNALPWHVGTGGNFSVTRAAFLQVGGNDENLGTGTPGRAGNDLDLFRRLMRAGVQARYEPDLLVQHERSTKAEFRSRCYTYGFGIGVCITSWLVSGDKLGWRALVAWLVMRARMLIRRPRTAGDELRVLIGTAQGLWHGGSVGHRKASNGLGR